MFSNKIKDAREALKAYRDKNTVENCFDDLNNHMVIKRLQVHTSEEIDGRLFLQFLPLIYFASIRSKIQSDDKLKYMTAREILEVMETLVKVKYSNRNGQIFTEAGSVQKRIMKVFDIKLPA